MNGVRCLRTRAAARGIRVPRVWQWRPSEKPQTQQAPSAASCCPPLRPPQLSRCWGSTSASAEVPEEAPQIGPSPQARSLHSSRLQQQARGEAAAARPQETSPQLPRTREKKSRDGSIGEAPTGSSAAGKNVSIKDADCSEETNGSCGVVDQWFESIDANRDGLISQREFRTWYFLHFLPNAPGAAAVSQRPEATEKSQDGELALSSKLAEGRKKRSSAFEEPASQRQREDCTDPKILLQRLASLERQAASLRQQLPSHLKQPASAGLPSSHAQTHTQVRLPPTLLLLVAFRSSIPYVGFGLMDNCLMLLCGELIDIKLGAALGLTTLAAAGLGNMISCITGVVTGGFIERAVYRLKWLPRAKLSAQQAESSAAKNAHILGSAVGISVGCLLGLFPLLILPQKKQVANPRQLEPTEKVV